jgi:signal transduction histidine kinase
MSAEIIERVRVAQEAERRRAARDIHDRLGYWLGLAHVELELYELYQHRDLGKAGAHLIVSRQAVAEGLAEIRRMITDLRSPHPVDCLEKALRLAIEALAAPSTSVTMLVSGDDQELTDHTRGELFLVLREALRNSVTHGEPATITVIVDISPNGTTAAVTDDGAGFDPGHTEEGGGIAAMRERIALLGGTLSVTSAPGNGCAVKISLPSVIQNPGRDGGLPGECALQVG